MPMFWLNPPSVGGTTGGGGGVTELATDTAAELLCRPFTELLCKDEVSVGSGEGCLLHLASIADLYGDVKSATAFGGMTCEEVLDCMLELSELTFLWSVSVEPIVHAVYSWTAGGGCGCCDTGTC